MQIEDNVFPAISHPSQSSSPVGENISYKDMLVGKGLVSEENWCDWNNDEDVDDIQFEDSVSDDEMEAKDDLLPTVTFTKEGKESMRKPWHKSLIVKHLEKIWGFKC